MNYTNTPVRYNIMGLLYKLYLDSGILSECGTVVHCEDYNIESWFMLYNLAASPRETIDIDYHVIDIPGLRRGYEIVHSEILELGLKF